MATRTRKTTKQRPTKPEAESGGGATMPELPPLETASPAGMTKSETPKPEKPPTSHIGHVERLAAEREQRANNGVEIYVPIGAPVVGGYRSNHVDVQLSTRQTTALHHVLAGLDAAGERLDDGRRVHHKVDAVRWVFDQVADQLGI
jgi:hypothetical protein